MNVHQHPTVNMFGMDVLELHVRVLPDIYFRSRYTCSPEYNVYDIYSYSSLVVIFIMIL